MELVATSDPPRVEGFTPLSSHQDQTPSSFFGGRPVLHLHSPNAKIRISKEELESQAALAHLATDGGNGELNGDAGVAGEDQVIIDSIDVWVTSSHLILFHPTRSVGVQISYPTITVHAQEGSAVFLGLNLSDANTADDDIVFVQMRIVPTQISTLVAPDDAPAQQHELEQEQEQESSTQTNGNGSMAQGQPAQALFRAISDCQELNPDPPEQGDEMDGVGGEGEAGFDATAPGATGWITSENMQDFVDENGEFRMPEGMTVIGEGEAEASMASGEPLGEGAGRVRTADEADAPGGVNGGEQEEAKWQRTS